MSIKERYILFKKEIPESIHLIAVSKTKSVEDILEMYNCNHKDFGENYVQELVTKYELLPKDIRWHFIGHLQSNKVKFIAPFVYLIQGVDSLKLLIEIQKQAKKHNRIINCLLQIHIAKEESKFGFSKEEIVNLLPRILSDEFNQIKILGLMGMATNIENERLIREEYKFLAELFLSLKEKDGERIAMKYLSMGMSGDYKIAIQERSNMIRIGSLLFGERNYKN